MPTALEEIDLEEILEKEMVITQFNPGFPSKNYPSWVLKVFATVSIILTSLSRP